MAIASSVADTATEASPHRFPAWPVAWFGMLLFCLAQIVSTVDRGILTLVVDPVSRDIGASDVQIGLLQGAAFAIFYVVVGVPLGLVADRVSRRRLLILGITVWSVATLCGGLAHDFRSMFLSRLFVGMGEATLGPCAVSMVGDLFPPSRRGAPMAFYMLGGAVSSGVAYLITGAVLAAAPRGAFDVIPLLRGLAPWRISFLICGALGFVVAALFVVFRDPPRQGVSLKSARGWGIRSAAAYFGENWPIFAPFYGSIATYTMGVGGIAWGAVYLIRHFGLAASAVGKQLGLFNIAGACIGSVIAMVVVDAVAARGGLRAKLQVAPLLPLIAAPCGFAVLATTPSLAMILVATPMFALPIYGAFMLSCTVEMTPANMRGVAVSLYALSVTLIGTALGPLAVAAMTQYVFKSPAMVGWSLLVVALPLILVSSGLMGLSRRAALRALERPGGFKIVVDAG